jgi:hypothetical protein
MPRNAFEPEPFVPLHGTVNSESFPFGANPALKPQFSSGSTATSTNGQSLPTFGTFAEAAKVRKERQQTSLKEEIEKKAFDPSSQVCIFVLE